ncbi:MAG TPA: ATP-binding protein [Burkholderiales bacterium]
MAYNNNSAAPYGDIDARTVADACVRIEQVRLIYANLPITQVVTLLIALALLSAQWSVVDHGHALAWAALLGVTTVSRIVLGIRFGRWVPTLAEAERFRRHFLLSAAIAGIVWGSTAFLLYPAESVVHQVFLAFVLAGLVAGGMTALTPVLPAFFVFSACALLPVIGRYLAGGDLIHGAMGATGLVFLLSLLLIGRRIHDTIARSLHLRFENDQLIGDLKRSNEILEQRVRERTFALEEADRRKNEFMAMLAHELRNPIAPMSAAVSVLAQANSPAMRNDALAVMRRHLQQMVRLVDDLLDINRIQRGVMSLRMETVSLSGIVRMGVETVRPLIDASGQQLEVTLPSEPLYVRGDEARLAQVVSNLLNNACKFTDHGGVIRLAVERQESEVAIRVTDTGIGIAANQLETIFNMFTQVDGSLTRSEGGLGIGLALVKQLVELHAGSVTARSEGPGHGSEFVVRLPVAAAGSLQPARREPQRRAPSRPRNILVIDDNVDAAKTLAILLRTKGHEVREAFDGEHAIAIASEFNPEVVVCDVAMPGMSGYEVATRLRKMFPAGLTLIAVSGYGAQEDRERSRRATFDVHLVKPANIEELQSVIDSAPQNTTVSP